LKLEFISHFYQPVHKDSPHFGGNGFLDLLKIVRTRPPRWFNLTISAKYEKVTLKWLKFSISFDHRIKYLAFVF
jgi:hypothetical protein